MSSSRTILLVLPLAALDDLKASYIFQSIGFSRHHDFSEDRDYGPVAVGHLLNKLKQGYGAAFVHLQGVFFPTY